MLLLVIHTNLDISFMKGSKMKIRVFLYALVAIVLSTIVMLPISARADDENIVRSVKNAPIVPDGTTTGRPPDFVMTLNSSLNPKIPGRTLLKGNQIKVTLPEAFENTQILILAL